MAFVIEVLQENGLFEIIEETSNETLALKWYEQWQNDLPDKTIRLAEHHVKAVSFKVLKEIKES